MASVEDLLHAVRSGKLASVKAALEGGAPVELDDGGGAPGLPLGIACFMGHVEIVRELVEHGAKVNLSDNWEPISPLSMATRGHRTEVVRVLVELGADVPAGMETGLSPEELAAAQWHAYRLGKRAAPPVDASGEIPEVEEIVMSKPFGVDTSVLEADVLRAAKEMGEKKSGKR
ncbi:MAG TPA: ankyrin repeat domain-containing protein [Rhodocyclaceae bacterium]|nr:ankyrin repeat domain-containing protein [Rhodocyclaceae bacterium]